ncbi:hypothetical protein Q6A88_01995 [Aliarcobacter skirrowii]|uniref:DUF4276 family protein n=1 Tax=Aliarcobacter skirrowii TaxID=28200 RepID=UPI0029B1FED4|nr:hypothetical protein [Aliarcobacter skirrowii]MDX4070472.1 hypothetical protein [Aliarcobacter skirrowii]
MHLVLSGEGKTDIGLFSYENEEFIPAPMYYIIDKIIEKKLNYSIHEDTPTEITFIPKALLIETCKSFKVFSGKKQAQETIYFYKNALGLSKIAKEKCEEKKDNDVIAVLFRDCDGTGTSSSTLWDDKIKSMETAFEQEKINGIPMIPNPKSEAWLICALKNNPYQHCEQLEIRSGNDDSPNNLKDELKAILVTIGKEYNNINEMIKNEEIDIYKIKMPSFDYFLKKLESSL